MARPGIFFRSGTRAVDASAASSVLQDMYGSTREALDYGYNLIAQELPDSPGWAQSKNKASFVAHYVKGKPVSMAAVIDDYSYKPEESFRYISAMLTGPEHRGKGYATKLLRDISSQRGKSRDVRILPVSDSMWDIVEREGWEDYKGLMRPGHQPSKLRRTMHGISKKTGALVKLEDTNRAAAKALPNITSSINRASKVGKIAKTIARIK